MNIGEILRALADKLDSIEQPQQSSGHGAELMPVDVDNTDHTEDAVFIAPLQQKIELLKKSVGVPSAFDDVDADGSGQESDVEAEDEMSILRRNAGVPVIAIHDDDVLG